MCYEPFVAVIFNFNFNFVVYIQYVERSALYDLYPFEFDEPFVFGKQQIGI